MGTLHIDLESRSLRVPVSGGAKVLGQALRILEEADIRLDDVGLHRPTLDDVFMTLTGHAAANDKTKGDAA